MLSSCLVNRTVQPEMSEVAGLAPSSMGRDQYSGVRYNVECLSPNWFGEYRFILLVCDRIALTY